MDELHNLSGLAETPGRRGVQRQLTAAPERGRPLNGFETCAPCHSTRAETLTWPTRDPGAAEKAGKRSLVGSS